MFKVWDELVPGCLQGGTNNVATLSCIPAIFSNLLSALLAFAGLTALLMFIMGGYKFINSGGDPKKAESAKNNFTYGILGLAIVLFSFVVINVISQVTGVTCITKFGFGCQ